MLLKGGDSMPMKRMPTIVALSTLAIAAVASSLADASETITYTYDAKGRLVKVVHTGTVNDNVMSNYSLDAMDNRKVVKVTGAP
jgi:YD repeat-containing protein